MNLPRLYVDGKFKGIVNAVSVSITENIVPLSSASIILPRGQGLPARSWVEMFTPYGSAGMFRVRSPHDAYGSDTTTAELEHMISEVGEWLVKEEIKEMLPANTAMTRVFSHYKGGKWKLGNLSALGTGNVACEANYDRVLDSMLAILEQKPDCYMKFDFKTTPWTINFATKGKTVAAEGRLARNISSATVTYDDSELVTRVWYQTFANNKGTWTHKDAPTVSKYGIIEGQVSTSSDMTADEITHVVDTYLKEHQYPRASVSMEADELSELTHEPLDRIEIGKLYRLALPDYDLTVEENVTSMTWSDVYNFPRRITVNLGAEEDTVVTFLHNLDATGGGGGGGGRKQEQEEKKWQEYSTKITQNDRNITLAAQRVDQANNILEQAGIAIQSDGVYSYAWKETVHSMIKQQADRISLVVRGTGKDAKIDTASIVLGINNQTGSYVKIKAQTINLSGYVTMKAFEAESAKISNLTSGRTTATSLKTNLLSASTGFNYQGHSVAFRNVTIEGTTYHLLGY